MKLPFTNQVGDDVRSLISNSQVDGRFEPRHLGSYGVVGRRARAAGNRKSGIANRPSQRGIALVITLILLSVTLVMAVAFLAISRRESSSVTTTTDSATARLAAESALAAAESQIIATMLTTTNPYNYGLLVSTNYINPNGFSNGIANPDNVNYDYYNTGPGPLSGADLEQNIANLFYSPRAPVFIATNGGTDFRFYLDLNRNGRFDTNGNVPDLDNNLNPLPDGTTSVIGDPEWVGVLERPDTTHGPNNKFLSRYAFIAIPVGNTLDINYIHNQAFTKSVATMNNDGFLRNQGVGSWEINLAAFLADLNTNQWDPQGLGNNYNYQQAISPGSANSGAAFNDAFSLLSYRYNGSYNTLASVNGMYANGAALQNDNIDEYSDGPLQTTLDTNGDFIFDDTALSWLGADNANHFFTLADLFDPTKTSFGVSAGQVALNNYFTGRLLNAGTGNSTYDRYTFYRMLSQLGTDSTPESGLMNVNYDNLDPGFNGALNASGTASVTNFVPWTPINFFTNAADRMLRLYTTNWFYASLSTNAVTTNSYLATYYGLTYTNQITSDQFGQLSGLINSPYPLMTNQVPAFGVTHIPVLMYGQFVYSPAVNRVLQLAANMYDATTNNTSVLGKDYPSVFRPTFLVTNEFGYKNVYINGYEYVGTITSGDARLFQPLDAANLVLGSSVLNYGINGVNVYGVPWIIGAKKGFPSFNEFSMESVMQVTRKLQLSRATNSSGIAHLTSTNQMYIFNITNSLGVEFWNSYTNGYFNNVQVVGSDNLSMTLTNGVSTATIYSNYNVPIFTNVAIWPGSTWTYNALNQSAPSPFVIPIETNIVFLPDSDYNYSLAQFFPINPTPPNWDTNTPATLLSQFGLVTTNRLQIYMLDTTGQHIIDYVQFSGPDSTRNVNAELADPPSTGVPAYMWSTNLYGSSFVPYGVVNQINVSSGQSPLVTVTNGGSWLTTTPPGYPSGLKMIPTDEAAFFHGFLVPNSVYTAEGQNWTNTSLVTQAPYTPTRIMVQYTSWQANDPLVHYLASDLNFSGTEQPSALSTGTQKWYGPASLPMLPDIGQLNDRYEPWGTINYMASLAGVDKNAFNPEYKDPLMLQSDYWDFPTYKLPTVGWLGRVHRGTPWQTVYLKASQIDIGTWTNWTGNVKTNDAINALPTTDHLLFDLFTTAPNDNATRGQLPINQSAANTNDPITGVQLPRYDPIAGLAAWSALFSGMVVPTSLTNTYTIINPAGVTNINSTPIPPLLQLVTNINFARAHIANRDGVTNAFEHVGSILVTPQLTEQSPFLVGLNITNSVNDELMEWLPQQAMSLLRAPSAPRYVIYCYGQALKPAPNSIVTSSGNFFQMCTNYQVVTESAARAVIRVDGANTPSPHIVVESFNLLPPD